MKIQRGDIVLVPIRFSSGAGTKTRPVLVVQSDHNNRRLQDTIVAVITSSIARASRERTQLLIEVSMPPGNFTGLLTDSAVTCEHLHTIRQSDIHRVIGALPASLMKDVDECLKASLGIGN